MFFQSSLDFLFAGLIAFHKRTQYHLNRRM
jgi:hypothetical protein